MIMFHFDFCLFNVELQPVWKQGISKWFLFCFGTQNLCLFHMQLISAHEMRKKLCWHNAHIAQPWSTADEKKARQSSCFFFVLNAQSNHFIATLRFVMQQLLHISFTMPKKKTATNKKRTNEIPFEKFTAVLRHKRKRINNARIRNHVNAINICNGLCMEIWPVQLNSINGLAHLHGATQILVKGIQIRVGAGVHSLINVFTLLDDVVKLN